jgi:hypothetical protein
MIGAAVVIVVARYSIVETERRKAERLNIKLVLRKKVNYLNIEYCKLREVRLYVLLVLRKKVNYRERSEIVCRFAGHEVADWDIARLRCINLTGIRLYSQDETVHFDWRGLTQWPFIHWQASRRRQIF